MSTFHENYPPYGIRNVIYTSYIPPNQQTEYTSGGEDKVHVMCAYTSSTLPDLQSKYYTTCQVMYTTSTLPTVQTEYTLEGKTRMR